MRHPYTLLVSATLLIVGFLMMPVAAQITAAHTTAQERAAKLRQQLADLQLQQTELQTRLQQVEEELKPENIEKGLAGVGSTRPEDLREQRRRELEIEKKGLQTRLDQFAVSRTRLETGIAQADADAYHRSANGPTAETKPNATQQSPAQSSINSSSVRRRARRASKSKPQPRRIRRPAQEFPNQVRSNE